MWIYKVRLKMSLHWSATWHCDDVTHPTWSPSQDASVGCARQPATSSPFLWDPPASWNTPWTLAACHPWSSFSTYSLYWYLFHPIHMQRLYSTNTSFAIIEHTKKCNTRSTPSPASSSQRTKARIRSTVSPHTHYLSTAAHELLIFRTWPQMCHTQMIA